MDPTIINFITLESVVTSDISSAITIEPLSPSLWKLAREVNKNYEKCIAVTEYCPDAPRASATLEIYTQMLLRSLRDAAHYLVEYNCNYSKSFFATITFEIQGHSIIVSSDDKTGTIEKMIKTFEKEWDIYFYNYAKADGISNLQQRKAKV